MFGDLSPPSSLADYYKIIEAKSPKVGHVEDYFVEDTQVVLRSIENLIKEYNSEDSLCVFNEIIFNMIISCQAIEGLCNLFHLYQKVLRLPGKMWHVKKISLIYLRTFR